MKKSLKISGIVLVCLTVLSLSARIVLKKTMGEESFQYIGKIIMLRLGMDVQNENEFLFASENTSPVIPYVADSNIKPFKEIGQSLGDLAKRNNTTVVYNGIAVFDANGDGLLDLYFPHSGRPIAKMNDENGILDPTTPVKAKPGALYLNMGNDEFGNPIYQSVQDQLSANSNGRLERSELLIENKYLPRNSISEDPYGVGRVGQGAVGADFNGDGRNDLLVLNGHYGISFTKPGLGVRIYPANANLGRDSKDESEYIETTLPPFLSGDMVEGQNVKVDFGGSPEQEGRNTLYLNMGDQDGDGIPEWKDATEEVGMISGWASASASVGDIDRDGDLDIYVCNFMDPDFWGFGAQRFGGNPNELWVNQLAESGQLSFVEKAGEFKVAGLHKEENLPSSMFDPVKKELIEMSYQEWKGEQVGEEADHSWASQLVDFNNDGYLDLVVANDVLNRLRVYENQAGKGFKIDERFNEAIWNGSWMGIASGDLDGDLKDEIMLSNFGSGTISIRNTTVFASDPANYNVTGLGVFNYIDGHYTAHHSLLSFDSEKGLVDRVKDTYIDHSPYIAPDLTERQNCTPDGYHLFDEFNYSQSIASLEFAWNPVFFDIENDGDLDVYMVGSLARGNDGFIGDWTGGPGRMLVNKGAETDFHFKDQTLEYQLMDIVDMEYDATPPRRQSPGTNWHKKDYVYLQDRDSYSGMGLEASRKSRIKDIFRMHENANGVVAADLNNDGFQDLVVLHGGGNNNTLPTARNLKINALGKELAMPAPNKVIKAPTDFEDGPTFMYINPGAPEKQESNWVAIQLFDENAIGNQAGIGAKVIVNDKIMRRYNVGGASFSAVTEGQIHVGLGEEQLYKIEIHWPTGDQKPQIITFDQPIVNEQVLVSRDQLQ